MKSNTRFSASPIQILLACAALLLALSTTAFAQERTYINPSSPSGTGSPFSGAVLSGNTLYISGMLGVVNGERPADAKVEARNMLDSIKATLAEAGMTMDDLVYVQIFCSDVSDYAAFNEVYRTYFTQEFPARAFVGAGTLLFNARFEMQSIAVKR
jgi:2-iminobutanoate/2-iminopropanoate deaminase